MMIRETVAVEISRELYDALDDLADDAGCSVEEMLNEKIQECIIDADEVKPEEAEDEMLLYTYVAGKGLE